MLADEYRRAGLGDAEAQRAAAAKFGSMTSAAEAYRDRRSVPALEQVVGDCRYAARSLGQTRILSASMILVLALGIGVTTTLVTLFHAVAFRALPLPDADRIVKLSLGIAGEVNRRVNGHVSQFSYPELTLYQDTTRALSGVAGFRHERCDVVPRRQPPSHRRGARHRQLFQRAAGPACVGPAPDRRRSSAASRRDQSPALDRCVRSGSRGDWRRRC